MECNKNFKKKSMFLTREILPRKITKRLIYTSKANKTWTNTTEKF